MTIDIEKMKAAASAATQGEWVVSDHMYAADGKRVASYQMLSRNDDENDANATHIATASPSAVLKLIEQLAEYKADAARYLEALKAIVTEDQIVMWNRCFDCDHNCNEVCKDTPLSNIGKFAKAAMKGATE